jgi:hypothetical protein
MSSAGVAWWGGKHSRNKGIWTDLYNDIKTLVCTQAFFQSSSPEIYFDMLTERVQKNISQG